MARNTVKKVQDEDLPSVEEVSKALSDFVAETSEHDAKREESLKDLKPNRKFRAMNSGWVMEGGVKCAIRAGKIITEGSYNIANLKAQGIMIEEIKDELWHSRMTRKSESDTT